MIINEQTLMFLDALYRVAKEARVTDFTDVKSVGVAASLTEIEAENAEYYGSQNGKG
jgi:hypothetical protein